MGFLIGLVENIIANVFFPIFEFLFGIFHKIFKGKFYKALFSTLGTNNPQTPERYRLQHYVKHSFVLENSETAAEFFSYRQFIKMVKTTKFVILTGSAGIGKSKLMQRLALQFRSRIQKGTKGGILSNFGILFYKLTGDETVDGIVARIKSDIGNSQISYTLFLDGLDEMSDLHGSSADEILKTLIRKLKEVSLHCKKIFISLRPEILEKGYSFSKTIPEVEMVTFKIKNFSEQQILAMYRNESRKSMGNHVKMIKISNKTRRDNLAKLKLIVKNNPQSVFTYPLILTWANEILSNHTVAELQYISWFNALGEVIDKEFEREYVLYSSSRNLDYSNDACSEFGKDGKDFLKEIALKMALLNKQKVTQKEVLDGDIAQRIEATYGKNTLMARHLLQYIDWSETSHGEIYYEFLHNTIFWRALAEALLDPNTPQSIRAQIILTEAKNKFSTPLLQYCRQGLWSVYGKNVLPYQDELAYMRDIDTKTLRCCTMEKTVPLEVVLSCCYGFNEVTVDSLRFDSVKIQEFVNNRKLDLSYSNVKELTFLKNFSNNSFDYLDCSNSDASIAIIPDYVKKIDFHKCTALKGVYINDLSSWCNIEVRGNPLYYAGKLYMNGELVTDLVIPDNVIKINNNIFTGCSSIKSVTISDGVKYIGDGAFGGCSSVEHVILPDSLKYIGSSAFERCISLKDITIPNSVKNIADYAFAGCVGLKTLNLGKSIERIEQMAFVRCTSLTNLLIPDSVFEIDAAAFRDCSSIKRLILGKGVKKIEWDAFTNCTGLTEIIYNATSYNGFEEDGDSSPDPNYAQFKNAGKFEDGITLIIGANVAKIPAGLFYTYASDAPKITKVNFMTNSECKHIGAFAFCGCNLIEELVFPDSIKSIGSNAISNCDMLKKVHLGANFESMVYPFVLCKSLIEISVSNNNKNYKSIDGILYSFDGKTLVRFPEGKLDTSFNVPKSVNKIGDWAFSQCNRLKEITLPTSIISIGDWAFINTAYYKNKEHWENGILYIDKHIIKAEGTLPENYKIKSGTLTIAKNAFSDHVELKSITFPKSIIAIDEYAFSGCKGLTKLRIPNNVVFIGQAAFSACDSLVEISVKNDNKNYKSIDGNLYSSDGKTLMQYAAGKSETSFCVPTSVINFGKQAFRHSRLASITLPNRIVAISERMFEGCQELTSIKIPDGVTFIGKSAFASCIKLINLVIANSVKNIDDGAFEYCQSLISVALPTCLEKISNRMFDGCNNLSSLVIPESVTLIDHKAFFNCWSLLNIKIPESVTEICLSAFCCNYSPPKGVMKIFYDGTIEQWNKIEKVYTIEQSFRRLKEIECNDGIVKLK